MIVDLRLRRSKRHTARLCDQCKTAEASSIGALCEACLERQPTPPLEFVQSSVVELIDKLEKFRVMGATDEAVAAVQVFDQLLKSARRAHDALELCIRRTR